MLERGADGEAEGEAADGNREVRELLFEIKRGGIAFEGGIECENQLFNVVRLNAGCDPIDPDGGGGAAVKGRQEMLYNMVESSERTGLFDGVDVARGGEDAKGGEVSARGIAKKARSFLGEATARFASDNFSCQV